jgi:hypothetical protein
MKCCKGINHGDERPKECEEAREGGGGEEGAGGSVKEIRGVVF